MSTALARRSDRPTVHLVLLGLTLLSTFAVYFLVYAGGWNLDASPRLARAVEDSILFSLSVVAILGTHEMGHYFFARYHGVDTTLPYFIPVPLGFGTLGAVIRIKAPIPTRNALVDIGASGPLTGLFVAIPILFVGFSESRFIPIGPGAADTLPGDTSLLATIEFLRQWWSGTWVEPNAVTRAELVYGESLITAAFRYLWLGPIPDGHTVQLSPMALAGWFGCVVTMLNLIPIGQLDGGHLAYALFGDRARRIGRVCAGVLTFAVFFVSLSWVVWLLVTSFLVRFSHPPVVDPSEPLSPGRRRVCYACAVALVLCVIPVPVRQVLVP